MNDRPHGAGKNVPAISARHTVITLDGRTYEVRGILGDPATWLTLVVVPQGTDRCSGPIHLVQAVVQATTALWASISNNTPAADEALVEQVRLALQRFRTDLQPAAHRRTH